jgi:hypothetical protein
VRHAAQRRLALRIGRPKPISYLGRTNPNRLSSIWQNEAKHLRPSWRPG